MSKSKAGDKVLVKLDKRVIDKTLSKVWNDFLKDERFKKALIEKNYTFEQFTSSIEKKINEGLQPEAEMMLGTSQEDLLVLWANVVIDVLMCFAIVANIQLVKDQRAVNVVVRATAGMGLNPAQLNAICQYMGVLRNGQTIQQVQALINVTQIIFNFYGVDSLKNIISDLVSGLEWWEVTLTVLEFVGWIALILVSDGAALYVKYALIAVTILILADDIYKLFQAYQQ